MELLPDQCDSATQRVSHFSFRLILTVAFIASVILSILMPQTSHAAEPREVKRVLILFSEDKDHPAHRMTEQGIREAFLSNRLFDVQLYTE